MLTNGRVEIELDKDDGGLLTCSSSNRSMVADHRDFVTLMELLGTPIVVKTNTSPRRAQGAWHRWTAAQPPASRRLRRESRGVAGGGVELRPAKLDGPWRRTT
jgi:hypothetical protein